MEKKTTPLGKADKRCRKKPKKLVRFLFLLIILGGFIMMVGAPMYNVYAQSHPVNKKCLTKSVEVLNKTSGTGGVATSSTELKISTVDCGTVYVNHVEAPKKSYQEMADELNRYQGREVALIFSTFQLPAQGDYVLGYGYRL